nr:RHOMBOID-like protein 2 [Ipomoea trifida]
MGGAKIRNNGATTLSAYYWETSEEQWTSFLVPMIVLANVVMFVITMFVNDCPHNIIGTTGFGRSSQENCVVLSLGRFSFQPLRENPLFGPSSSTLEKLGALDWNKTVHEHQEWRLVTCIWLHAGVFHLLANMLSLIFVGVRLEQQFGFGIGGSIVSSLFIQHGISVGASGALFGLLGAMLSELLTNWTIYSNKAAALLTLLVIILINLGFGILPHVNNFAHIGGFFSGFLLGFVLLLLPQFGWYERTHLPGVARLMSKYTICQRVSLVAASVLFITGAIFGVAAANYRHLSKNEAKVKKRIRKDRNLRQQSRIIEDTLGSMFSGMSSLRSMKPTTPTTFIGYRKSVYKYTQQARQQLRFPIVMLLNKAASLETVMTPTSSSSSYNGFLVTIAINL